MQNAKMLHLYKLYTQHILISFIFMIWMFCNLICTCSLLLLITKIDWIHLDRRRSKKEVSDKKTFDFFWNSNVLKRSWHHCIAQFCVMRWCFVFFVQFLHNIEITWESLLEKNMEITKYFKKSNDKLDGCVLNSFVPCSSTSSVLSAARDEQSARGTRL